MLKQRYLQGTGLVLLALIGLFWVGVSTTYAQGNPNNRPNTNAIYLPLIAGSVPTNTPAATPTATATRIDTPTVTPTATPTTLPVTLPSAIVATWYSGNTPLNDFYNPDTGEWRDVNGLGQMVEFAANGTYTYTGFIRLQNGACRSEVSTFKRGTASIDGNALTMNPTHVRTRSVMICGSVNESFTEGPYDPTIQLWQVNETEGGQEQLTIGTAAEATTFYKAGLVASLAGPWQSDALEETGFYNSTTNEFDLASPDGMWFNFGLDGTYRYGEHTHGQANEQGCANEWWIYQQGSYQVTGGRLTITPAAGQLRLVNSCAPDAPTQEGWLDDARDYTWFYRDRTTAIKLVIIPLSPFVEFIFHRP